MNNLMSFDNSSTPRVSNAGFTLIEVLVSMLIIAVGVLGIAALQFKALRYSHDASMRSQISFLAYGIADRMRINRANIAAYVGNHTVATPDVCGNGIVVRKRRASCQSAAAASLAKNQCIHTDGADATNDINCWHNAVDYALPPGSTANIVMNNTSSVGDLYTITLAWSDREGQTHTVEYSLR